jgi:PAS domain S-box-containing protein
MTTVGDAGRSTAELLARAVRASSVAVSLSRLDDGSIVEANDAFLGALGLPREAAIGRTMLELGLWVDAGDRADLVRRVEADGRVRGYEARFRTVSGAALDLLVSADMVEEEGERYLLIVGQDLTERNRADVLALIERRLLEKIAIDAALPEVLESLCRDLESFSPGMLASVLLLDPEGPWLRHAAAPSLPPSFVRALDGLPIGPDAGSSGTAAHLGQRVVVTDIALDPLWEEHRSLALSYGLRACWSTPIRSSAGTVLGTFSIYDRRPAAPSEDDLRVVDLAARIAGIAAERMRDQDRAHRRARQQVGLAYLARQAAVEPPHTFLGEGVAMLARTLDADLAVAFEVRGGRWTVSLAVGSTVERAGTALTQPGPELLGALAGEAVEVPGEGPGTPMLREESVRGGVVVRVPAGSASPALWLLAAFWRRPRSIAAEEVRFVESVAGMVGLVAGRGAPAVVPGSGPARFDPLVAQRLGRLTARQRETLLLIGEGLSNREIGERLGLAEKTVRNRVSGLLKVLGMQRRTQAALLASKLAQLADPL